MTNYENVQTMSIDELTEFICSKADGYHTPNQNKTRRKEFKKWLNSEVEE